MQSLESQELEEQTKTLESNCPTSACTNTANWLADVDDWGDDCNDNVTEENGNNNLLLNACKYNNLDRELCRDFSDLKVDNPNDNNRLLCQDDEI